MEWACSVCAPLISAATPRIPILLRQPRRQLRPWPAAPSNLTATAVSTSQKRRIQIGKLRDYKSWLRMRDALKDFGHRPPPRPAPSPLSQFSRGELTMTDIRPTLFAVGCSNLAKTSQDLNEIIRQTSRPTSIPPARVHVVCETMLENSEVKTNWRKPLDVRL